MDMRLFEWDKTYLNPLYGKCCPERDFPILFEHYRQKRLLLDELVSRVYSLDELSDAFAHMLEGRNAKGVQNSVYCEAKWPHEKLTKTP